MCSVFYFIVFITIILFESIVNNIVTVGNYPDLNTQSCGQSRHSMGVETKCMKWHKDILSPIRKAKRVGLGDAPWAALLIFRKNQNGRSVRKVCSGSVFGNQWILTAGHCMNGAFNIKIYFGYNFTEQNPSNEQEYSENGVYIHPEFDTTSTTATAYDIALVRLSKPIENSGKHFLVNNICLPERWLGYDCRFNDTPNCNEREYGMAAGWGSGDYQGPAYLQMGYWRLWNERYDLSENPMHWDMKTKMNLDRLGNQSLCSGDSGGPVWQYDMGRAVIVGVIASSMFDNMSCATSKPPRPEPLGSQSDATWVDQVIDWIQSVVNNVTNQP